MNGNPTTIAALAALLALPVLACCTPKTVGAAPDRGKVEAPVVIDAALADGTARVTLRFEGAASDVRVGVGGVDGLTVTSVPAPIEGASFERGDVTSFDVTFTPGPGRSYLAVTVMGSFGGGRRAIARSFAVGTPTAEQEKPGGRVVEGEGGERIKVVAPGQ